MKKLMVEWSVDQAAPAREVYILQRAGQIQKKIHGT